MKIKKRIEIIKTISENNRALRRMEKSPDFKLAQKHLKGHDSFKYAKAGYIFPEDKSFSTRMKKTWDNIKAHILDVLGDE